MSEGSTKAIKKSDAAGSKRRKIEKAKKARRDRKLLKGKS